MTEKRFKYAFEGIEDTFETDEEYKYTPCNKDGFQDLCEMLNELHEENQQLQERNDRQAKRLDNLYTLIEKQNWKTLKGIIQEFQECDERLQKEWGSYGDVE